MPKGQIAGWLLFYRVNEQSRGTGVHGTFWSVAAGVYFISAYRTPPVRGEDRVHLTI